MKENEAGSQGQRSKKRSNSNDGEGLGEVRRMFLHSDAEGDRAGVRYSLGKVTYIRVGLS